MTLLQQFKDYLFSQKSAVSKTTIKNYTADVKRFISWWEVKAGKDFTPSLVTAADIADYKIVLLGTKASSSHLFRNTDDARRVSSSSAERYISSLRKFFAFLEEKKLCESNPFSERVQDPRSDQLSVWKIQEFKNALYSEKAADLTVKNYIIDVLQFMDWLSAVGHAGKHNPKAVFADINQQAIDEYKYRLFHLTKLSPSSINRKLSSLRKYFTWSNEAGLLPQVFLITSTLPSANELNAPLPEAVVTEQELLTPLPDISLPSSTHLPQGFLFAPIRLFSHSMQAGKLIHVMAVKTFDTVFILPLVTTYQKGAQAIWKLRGSPVFDSLTEQKDTIQNDETEQEAFSPARLMLSNIKKEFYAPLALATASMPGHQRLVHFLSYARPNWYKRYHTNQFVHYMHFAILLFVTALASMVLYDHMMPKEYQKSVLGMQSANNSRLLSFQGKLADPQGGAITAATDLRFSVYSDPIASQGALLWQETQRIKPDTNGSFTTLLGQNTPLPDTLANDTKALYLGLTVGQGKELLPRQHLTTSAFSGSAHKVQGMLPITAPNAGTKNVLLALDSTGSLSIGGSASPVFQATGGEFTLSGDAVLLTTNAGSSGDIVLAPDDLGKIDLQKPLHNTSEYSSTPGVIGAVEIADSLVVSATESAQSALVLNQNGTGNLISALSSGIAKFTLTYLGAATFADSLTVEGQDLGSSQATFNLLTNNVINLNVGRSATEVSIGANSGKTTINNAVTEIRGNLGVLGTNGISVEAQDAGIVFSGNGTHTISAKAGKLALDSVNLSGNVSLAKDISIVPQATDGVNNLGSAAFPFDNIYVNNIISPSLATAASYLQLIDSVLTPQTTTHDFALGGSTPQTAPFYIYGSGPNSGTASMSGNLIFKGSQTTLNQLNGGDMRFQTSPGGDSLLTTKVTIPGSGTNSLEVQGNLLVSGNTQSTSFSIPSDQRLKKDIASFEDGLSILKQINPVSYFYNGSAGTQDGEQGIGIIAQDVKDIIPYTIGTFRAKLSPTDTNETELLRFNSSALTFIAINAIKELDEKVFQQDSLYSELQQVLSDSSLENLELTPHPDGTYTVLSSDNSAITRTQAFSKILTASFLAGLTETQELVVTGQAHILGLLKATAILTNSLTTNLLETGEAFVTNTLSANTLLARGHITSPLATIDRLQTNLISPLSPDSTIALELEEDALTVRNTASQAAVASIDANGNASFSGTLRAKKIIADEIEGLPEQSSSSATYVTNITNVYNSIESSASGELLADSTVEPSLTASPSAQAQNLLATELESSPIVTDYNSIPPLSSAFSDVPTLTTEFATVTKGLMVFGPTSVQDLSSAGQIAIGGNMILADGGINVLNGDLELQPLRQGGISFLGGRITFDIHGNIDVQGNATFAKNVTINGTLATSLVRPVPESDLTIQLTDSESNQQLKISDASGSGVLAVSHTGDLTASGSGLFKQLAADTFKVVRSAQADTTSTETIASSSAGTIIIPAGYTEKTIVTPFTTEDSLIYLTPTSDTQQMSPYVARQTAENKEIGEKGSFTVRIQSPVRRDIQLNWWIIN